MRSRILFLTIALVLATGGLWFAWNERAARQAAERDLAAIEAPRSRLDADIQQAEQRLAREDDELRRAQAALEQSRQKVAAAKAGTTRKAGPAPAPITALRNALLNDPHLQNLQIAAVQLKLQGTYRPFGEQLKLSEAQMEQFFALLRKRLETEMDLSAIKETQQRPADDPVFVRMKEQAAGEFRAAQIALLGEAGFRQFEAYERAIPVREFLNEVVGATVVSGVAITGAQADALVESMANASPTYRQGGMAEVRTIDWDQVLAGAVTTLGEPQLAVFRNGVIQLRNMDRIRELARRK